jgi:hypothetical protein
MLLATGFVKVYAREVPASQYVVPPGILTELAVHVPPVGVMPVTNVPVASPESPEFVKVCSHWAT